MDWDKSKSPSNKPLYCLLLIFLSESLQTVGTTNILDSSVPRLQLVQAVSINTNHHRSKFPYNDDESRSTTNGFGGNDFKGNRSRDQKVDPVYPSSTHSHQPTPVEESNEIRGATRPGSEKFEMNNHEGNGRPRLKTHKKSNREKDSENKGTTNEKKNNAVRHKGKKEGHREIRDHHYGQIKHLNLSESSQDHKNTSKQEANSGNSVVGNQSEGQNYFERGEGGRLSHDTPAWGQNYPPVTPKHNIGSHQLRDNEDGAVDSRESEGEENRKEDVGDTTIISTSDNADSSLNENHSQQPLGYSQRSEGSYLSTSTEEALLLAIPLSLLLTLFFLTFVACCCLRQTRQLPLIAADDEGHYRLVTSYAKDERFDREHRASGVACCGCRALESCCLPDLSYQMHRAEWVKRYTLPDDNQNYNDSFEDDSIEVEEFETARGRYPPLYALLSNLPPQRKKKNGFDRKLRRSKSVELLSD